MQGIVAIYGLHRMVADWAYIADLLMVGMQKRRRMNHIRLYFMSKIPIL